MGSSPKEVNRVMYYCCEQYKDYLRIKFNTARETYFLYRKRKRDSSGGDYIMFADSLKLRLRFGDDKRLRQVSEETARKLWEYCVGMGFLDYIEDCEM
jgi:hypothetical protein